MRTLIHQAFDPFGRQIRLMLWEKNLHFKEQVSHPCDNQEDLLVINPAGTLPVLIDEPPTGGEIAVCPSSAIIEYLEEAYPIPALMPSTSAGRAETRRLLSWFNIKFDVEVSKLLTFQSIEKRLRRQGQPDPEILRLGRTALEWHMDYINYLCENRNWLAGDRMSVVDFSCAAHLSCLEYCDHIQWREYDFAKEWYVRIKSRPSFQSLLKERVPGLPAARHYSDLDY